MTPPTETPRRRRLSRAEGPERQAPAPDWWLKAREEPESWGPRRPPPDMPQQPPHTPLGGD
jgi:hypothetical protein